MVMISGFYCAVFHVLASSISFIYNVFSGQRIRPCGDAGMSTVLGDAVFGVGKNEVRYMEELGGGCLLVESRGHLRKAWERTRRTAVRGLKR